MPARRGPLLREPAIPPALPRLYRPEEIAEILGCSAWWVKDRARRRLIPFTRVGRSYRFTGDHLAEIIRMHEDRPAAPRQQADPPPTLSPRSPAPTPAPVGRLRARPPRRARQGQFGTAA
ncbi:helix-turn-helix domain-containing protein [Streptomyces boncukensis]|uniref:Helix-turn-helix domain-containing protein n=1 Tax=Streptomyces boncukensis TaxID=2711219 RepID=A0A6G4X6U0_9ACTN|nr:helix-turn-helix domain-containing protein [Streptomyces boncukensis]NGO73235.1 helix-turn-helix domain-containing protein [Streptomyces boncukensis]